MQESNVTWAKPKIGGAIYVAPVGSTLPTDAITALDAAFTELGYASDDGLSNDYTPDTDVKKAWGGDTVLVVNKGVDDTFKVKLIESTSVDVLKTVFGSDNVTGTLDAGVKVSALGKGNSEQNSYVIDMIMKNDVMKRIVIPSATISDMDTIEYKDDDGVGYDITLTCSADTSGVTHYEYISKAVTA